MTKKAKKKTVRKKSSGSHKKTTRKASITQTASEVKIEKILIENFVALQKVMTNLSVKFDSLSNQISKLLDLFEISAKALAKKEFDLEKGGKENERIIEKLDNLANQNKTIAKGLTMMHEHNLGIRGGAPYEEPGYFEGHEEFEEPAHMSRLSKEPLEPPHMQKPIRRPELKKPSPLPRMQAGYQKSISSQPEEPEE